MMYREDWQLGSIAPKRDVGEWRENFAVTPNEFRHLPPLTSLELKALQARPHYFEQDDYVFALTGKDEGKIGRVREVDHDEMSLTVENLNKVSACANRQTSPYFGWLIVLSMTSECLPSYERRILTSRFYIRPRSPSVQIKCDSSTNWSANLVQMM